MLNYFELIGFIVDINYTKWN